MAQYGIFQYGTDQYGKGQPVSTETFPYVPFSFNLTSIHSVVGESESIVKRNTFNQFDEHGYLAGIKRLQGETNWSYRRRIQDSLINYANSSYQGLINGITRELGLSLFQPLNINPKINLSTNEFLAPDPYILIDGSWIYLYSDYKNNLLDYKIDRHQLGGNYEFIDNLSSLINTTAFFESGIISGYENNHWRSNTLLNQSNRFKVIDEDINQSTKVKTKYGRIIRGSVSSNTPSFFKREVSSESNVVRNGDYYIDYLNGYITFFDIPSVGTAINYTYIKYPFLPIASPVILHNINDDKFRNKMFHQLLQDDGNIINGLINELGNDIVNEILSVFPMYWGT